MPVYAFLLVGYLFLLRPPNCPVWVVLLVAAVLGFLAWVVERVPPDAAKPVGVFLAILIAMVIPTVFIALRAHYLAEVALKGEPVQPFTIFAAVPVLDVSSDPVDVEWICSNNKNRPSIFDQKAVSKGMLLGQSPSTLFVRMDPVGAAPIVKLPAECVVVTRRDI